MPLKFVSEATSAIYRISADFPSHCRDLCSGRMVFGLHHLCVVRSFWVRLRHQDPIRVSGIRDENQKSLSQGWPARFLCHFVSILRLQCGILVHFALSYRDGCLIWSVTRTGLNVFVSWSCFLFNQLFTGALLEFTRWLRRIKHRKWKEIKLQPSRAILDCSLVSLHFRCWILRRHPVYYVFKINCVVDEYGVRTKLFRHGDHVKTHEMSQMWIIWQQQPIFLLMTTRPQLSLHGAEKDSKWWASILTITTPIAYVPQLLPSLTPHSEYFEKTYHSSLEREE